MSTMPQTPQEQLTDEREAFEAWASTCSLLGPIGAATRDMRMSRHEAAREAWQARAALATHPAPSAAPAQPVAPTTPSSHWKVEGEPDPHAGHYDGERAALTLGKLTDDELANGAFMNYDAPFDVHAVIVQRPGYHPPIVWMTAVKDRIRWLSRALEKALATHPPAVQPVVPAGWKLVPVEPTSDMIEAGNTALHLPWDFSTAPKAYRAMVAAAPSAALVDAKQPEQPLGDALAGPGHPVAGLPSVPIASTPTSEASRDL
jgi:hypothetical protein